MLVVAVASPTRIEASDQSTVIAGSGSPGGWRSAVTTYTTSAGAPSSWLCRYRPRAAISSPLGAVSRET